MTCIMIDQMYTATFRITTVYKPSWARRRWLRCFMSRMNPTPKQPTLVPLSANGDHAARASRVTYMQKKGEMRDERARARTEK